MAFHRSHEELPILAICVYLYLIFYADKWVSKPWNCKGILVMWNLFLAGFSVVGAIYLLPLLWKKIQQDGFRASVCESAMWYFDGWEGVFVTLFIYSKFLELMDTVFLIIRKKEVIFLHWFHHVTVLLFCWHSLHHQTACGIWFAAMNYFVHSLMYTYYALAIWGFKPIFTLAPLITTIQILQMVGGITVILSVAYDKIVLGNDCDVQDANWKLGLTMYTSYFILFSILFYDKYFGKKDKSKASKPPCFPDHKTDGAGFFHAKEDGRFETKKQN
eukprot:CAMPEP_0201520864 /NCGR_PEP_ID=MMETSP0161_2-20130828/12974_1 /ASSEMBLY_ACC=CAM_ASM_000251 /TAXON_ID=180227 /ORGANISM="Neoparamoeba aestuarina, Strain SoJaBio B1-5/56/2" /LENGTH=273 /DNA_ID=CAMNT_0047919373 /DNA_START=164 /DNA_END=985 /DNA_ORIENTATION=-